MSKTYAHMISLNVRGIRNKVKRNSIFQWLNDQKVDIALLQETFLDEELNKYISKEWSGVMLSTYGSLHSRGVSILFRKDLDIEIESHHKTIDGRKLLVNVKIGGDRYTIVNIYDPRLL